MNRWLMTGLISMTFAPGAIAADKHRQLDAHAHGHGSFNIAIEGSKVSMELEAPGADIVGFEHKARTKQQKTAVASAKAKLKSIGNVVELPAAAGCELTKASVELHIEGGNHDDHAHGKKKGHKHDHGHKDKKQEAKESAHSEFHAEYQLTCASPEKLLTMAFPYFKNFKGAKELEVSVVGPKSQRRFEVERDNGQINLGGVI